LRTRNRKWTSERVFPYAAISAYFVILSYFSILRYEAFTDAWDFGGFVQSLSNAAHGGFFLQTIDGYFAKGFPETEVISFFGLHFSPILYALVPIYAAFPYPSTLLVLQTGVIALGGLPVYWLASKRLGKWAGVVFLTLFLTYAPLLNMNLNDFHPEAMLPTILLFALYYMLEKRWKIAVPFLVLALSVIEEAGLLVFAILVFFFIYQRAWRHRRAATLLILGAVGSLAYTAVAARLPYYFGLDPNGFTLILNSQNYSVLGATGVLGVPAAILHSPQRVISALTFQFQDKILFMTELIAPVAFLPLFFPEAIMMAIPWIGTAFLSNYAGYYTIYSFHQAFIIFSVFPAAILGLERIKAKSPRITSRALNRYLAIILLVGIIFSNAQAFPASVYGNSFTVTRQNLAEEQLLGLLPSNASVLTTSDIFPHVANRLDAYTVPPATLRADYATTDQQILSNINPRYILLNMGSADGNIVSETDAILSAKVYNGTYGLVGYSDKVILLEEGYQGQPLVYDNPPFYNSTNLVFDTRWTVMGPNDSLYFPQGTNHSDMWFGPYAFFPAGNFTATFILRTSGPVGQHSPVITLDVDYGNLVTVNRLTLTGASFPTSAWEMFQLNFQLAKPVFDIQFRGMYPTNATGIYLQGISVEPS
jgi:uncharacterized membrane protein